MIDPHVHLRDGIQSSKETIAHGISVAFEGGISAFFDMPNTVPPLTDENSIIKRLELGSSKTVNIAPHIFYAVYAGITSDISQIKEVTAAYEKLFPHIVGLKMFAGHSTGNMGIIEKNEQRKVYAALAEAGYKGVIAVHCEKESFLKPELWNPADPASHSKARPPKAETESIKDQIELALQEGFAGHLHICHISTSEGINLVKKAKNNGVKISCGATAHHALLNTKSYAEKGLLVKMNPPLRIESDRKSVFEGLLSSSVDWIESDHAPHTLDDKQKGASGIPGFAGTLILISKLREAGCSESRLEELCGKNVNKVFGVDFDYTPPSEKLIKEVLGKIRKEYPFDAFSEVS